ncbi:MAG: ATP-dependent Clp protease adapter ClpS [Gammaproteobacteria bacterium]|nr:MAG: ATP-dependent Clp protease adapter ClpS [Gammaproteobacteria bacterium]
MSNQEDLNNDKDLGLLEAIPKLKKPSMYQVYLINDDYTPMDFVIEVLSLYFNMSVERAAQIMLQVHTEGRGTCGVFTIDVAQTKVKMVNEYSKIHHHPLLCITEKLD